MRPLESALVVVFVIAGGYFLLLHKDVPLSHEAVGLGTLHILHDVIGVVLLGFAGLVWWRSRGASMASPPVN